MLTPVQLGIAKGDSYRCIRASSEAMRLSSSIFLGFGLNALPAGATLSSLANQFEKSDLDENSLSSSS